MALVEAMGTEDNNNGRSYERCTLILTLVAKETGGRGLVFGVIRFLAGLLIIASKLQFDWNET